MPNALTPLSPAARATRAARYAMRATHAARAARAAHTAHAMLTMRAQYTQHRDTHSSQIRDTGAAPQIKSRLALPGGGRTLSPRAPRALTTKGCLAL